MSLPMRPRVRLNLTPNLLAPPNHINSDWVRVWWTSYILFGGVGGWEEGEGGHIDISPDREAFMLLYVSFDFIIFYLLSQASRDIISK